MSLFEELKRRNVVRVAVGYVIISWLLMQVGDTLGPALRLPEWIPSALAFFLILGFPVAMYLAWVYELTPEGIKPDRAPGRETGGQASGTRKLNQVIIFAVVLSVTFFAFNRFVLNDDDQPGTQAVADTSELTTHQNGAAKPDSRTSAPHNSIAVLPFINLSSDPEQEYFSDGLTEELLNLLARIPELQVTSRSSAFAYKGKEINIPKVAKSLGVAHILEGSVRKAGNQIRVTAQLIDAERDVHLWSATYEHTLENIFSIQDEISAAVVEALKITLLGNNPKARQVDARAMDLNLRARYFWTRRGEGDFERAREYYEKSLEIDDKNAPAWAGLAVIYTELIEDGSLPREEALTLSKQAALNAVAADPDYPEGHIRLSWAFTREGNRKESNKHRDIAAQLDPNNHLVIFSRAVQLKNIGRMDLAIGLFEQLARLDPMSAISHNNLGSFYIDLGRLKDAEAAISRGLELSPDNSASLFNLAMLRVLQGRFEEALEMTPALNADNNKQVILAIIYYALDQQEESQAAYDLIVDERVMPAMAWQIKVRAYRGELDLAFAMLREGVDAGIRFTNFIEDPLLENMQKDPRFDALMREAGWVPDATID